jgi:Protein of unknown function (DUF1579)
MTKIRIVSSTFIVALSTLAATAVAQDKKPAPPAMAAPKPAAAPAAAAPPAAMAPVAKPAMVPAAAPVAKPAMAPAAPAKGVAPMAAPAAAAAPPAAAPMPAPSKEMEAFMKGFEGSWKCDTKFAAGAMGPGSPEVNTKSTVKIKKEFGGFSWHGDYNMPKSKMMPAMSGVFQLGFDAGLNQATLVGYDSMGSAMLGVGPISADTVTINEEGYMMGMKAKVRETMTKKSPKEVYHKYEADMGHGLQVMGEDTCKK